MSRYLISLMFTLSLVTVSDFAYSQESGEITDAQMTTAINLANKPRGKTTFWRSDKLGLIYGYDERWKPANPSQAHTVSVVNWNAQASGSVMATCSIASSGSTQIAKYGPEQIRENAKFIVDSIVKNTKLSDPNAQLITWRIAKQDNYPVVYTERDINIENINSSYSLRIYSISTAWNGREVNFECASEVPIKSPKLSIIVEAPIKHILGSLQFVRVTEK